MARRVQPVAAYRRHESKPPVGYNWGGCREGETVRECVRCGAEYVPTMRRQRYCSRECREAARRERENDKPA